MDPPAPRIVPLGPLLSGPGSRAFLGVDPSPGGGPVVLIWVPDEVGADPARLARLRSDTGEAARIDHANVIRVLGCEEFDEGWARVVEYVDGESLRRILETAKAAARPLPPEVAARLVADACKGVHHAHIGGPDGRPLVHGDLRPETILVTFRGATKVTGYGAREVAPRPDVSGSTPRLVYRAPEQIGAGAHAAPTPAADVYALGAILYETLAGRPPFVEAEGDLEVAVLTRDPPRLALVTAPDALADVAARAMAKKPADRFPTASAVQDAIESALGPSAAAADDVARFLGDLFPETGREREARRQLLASAAAAAEPLPAVAPASSSPGPNEVVPQRGRPGSSLVGMPSTAPPERASAPAAPAPSAVPPPEAAEPAQAPRVASRRIVLLAVVAAAMALPAWRLWRGRTPAEPERPRGAVPQPVPQGPAAAGERGATAARPTPSPTAAPTGTLELEVDPAVEVRIDGKAVGRAPVKATLPSGRHTVRLYDRARGIDVARTVAIPAGRRLQERILLGTATLTVTAPPGSEVLIDGKAVGTAPIAPLTFYEGAHAIEVRLGGARTERRFNARAGDNLTLDVRPTP